VSKYQNQNDRFSLFKKYHNMFPVDEILSAYKFEGHKSFNIVGEKGIGKTVYAMTVMAQIFYELGNEAEKSWDLALDHLLFSKDDVIEFIKRRRDGVQIPVFCWDDIRAHASGMSYIIEPNATVMLLGLVDTIRDSVCGFLTTAPDMKGVLSFITRDIGYKVMIYGGKNHNERVAKGYYKFTTPGGQPRIKGAFVDEYPRFLPSDVYQTVRKKRTKYKEIIIKKYDEYLERKEKKQHEIDRIDEEKSKIESDLSG